MQKIQKDLRPGLWRLFFIWTSIGLQSFGGGATTNLLIQREFIEKRQWMTIDEYTHYWNLCLFAPGINLVALTILIGKKLGGNAGIFVSLLGLLFPSATITCLLAAGFKQVEHIHLVQAILQGVVPATAGIMLLVGINFAQPQLLRAYKEGPLNLILSVTLIALCTLAIIIKVPVFIVLSSTALLGVLCFTRPLFKKKVEER
ncbi:chromate transporter [Dictyobacter formicarum]|nr:chromate transporter [Dictyobacter formicarum]